jgi:beta-ribofuranosylaminobenzene 5'-phosphate synthase
MSVLITAPSRLHLSLIDLNGELGRVDGGIGVALNEPSLKIAVSAVDKEVEPEENPKEVVPVLERIRSRIEPALKVNYRVKILKELPSHVGLGSRTQLSLSVAKAISVLENRNHNVVELAKQVCRGGTSGVGTAAFDKGGFILDGGHVFRKDESKVNKGGKDEGIKTSFLPSSASKVSPPPVLFQHALPEDWFFVLAIPDVKRGAHGLEEIEVFKRYCPIKREEVERICRIVLMRTLPSVLEKDIATFAESLTMLQGEGFKKIEIELQHDIIKELFSFFDIHALGHGMSSFGPAAYAIVEGEKRAKELADLTNDFFIERHIRALVSYSNANNTGSEYNIFS